MRAMAAIDLLDFDAVRAWADGLVEALDLEPPPGS
jgi:hypothetical protein